MPDVNWYIQRLRAMSLSEIAHRTQTEWLKSQWRRQVKANKQQTDYKAIWSRMPETAPLSFSIDVSTPEAQRLIEEAEAYLQHTWYYGLDEPVREATIDWQLDPRTGKQAPLKFGFDVNHRDENVVGSIKNIWEKSRHHNLTVLASAYAITKDERYSAEVVNQILDWIEKNPYLMGVHWTHPMEQGIRLISWIWCERLIRGSQHYDRLFNQNSPFWMSFYNHQKFIEQTYSRGSSANNHLIGEMAGLFVAATAFPIFKESVSWQKNALRILESELDKQTFANGINRELAFSYQIFVIEFCLCALAEARLTHVQFSKQFNTILKKMMEIIPHLTDVGGTLPTYGDGDEGRGIQLQSREDSRVSWIYHVGASWLQADVPQPDDGKLMATLFGADVQATADTYQPPDSSEAFEDAGIFILADKRSTPEEIMVMADAGPHGYLSIAAHAHADALSFTMSVAGLPILVDTGTYSYHTDAEWREYFRGTKAHNTVLVDGLDQSIQQGHFLWTKKANTYVADWQAYPDGGLLSAHHDGYDHLGVIHQRKLELSKRCLTVTDILKETGQHHVALCYHVHPECQVEQLADQHLRLMRGLVTVDLYLPDQLSVELIKKGNDYGWYSPEFLIKQEITTIVAQAEVQLEAVLVSKLIIDINM